jgi:nucleotide-binding universal stress UspA family protein
VARGEVDRGGDILVGVDGSPAGASALDFAFEEAALRGVGITALHTYIYPVAGDPGDLLPLVYDADQLKDEETAVLAEAVAGWCERYPDVPVNQALVRDRASRALVHAADRAALVVVGCRGRGGFLGLVLGSVSQALLHHASCPVAIMR